MAENPNQVQKPPIGLLDALGILNQGQNPAFLVNSLSPTFELAAYYRARELVTVSQTDTVQAAGDSSIQTVPAGETWVVIAVGVNIGTGVGVGEVFDMAILVRTGLATNSVTVFRDIVTITAVTDRTDRGLMLPQPLILPAGSTITVILERTLLGVAQGITSRHIVQRLRTGA